MATLRLSKVQLVDRWPGAVNPNLGKPTDGWDSTVSNFQTTSVNDVPAYPLGTKIMAYTDNTNCPGWYTMMYLAYHSFEDVATACISQDFSDGLFWCSHSDASTSQFSDTSVSPYYVVMNCYTTSSDGARCDFTKGGALAIPCATMDSDATAAAAQGYGDSYGWFWVGGVCPCKDVTIMDNSGATKGADFTTALARGPAQACVTAKQIYFTQDMTDLCDTTNFNDCQVYGSTVIACSSAA